MSATAVATPSIESATQAPNFTFLRARRAFSRLEGWLMSPEAMGLPEHEVEAGIGQRGREVMRLMLQAHLNGRGTGEVGEAIVVRTPEGGGRRQEAKRVDPRQIVSIFGEVSVRRTAYVAPGCEAIHPLDAAAQLPARSFSYELQPRVVEEAVRGPFDEAIQSIEKNTGNRLPKRSAEQIVAEAAQDFDAFYAQRRAPSAGETGPILVAAVDCKGVPLVKAEGGSHTPRRKKGEKANKKKMATVAAVFTQQPRVRSPQEVVESLFEGKRPEGGSRVRPEHKRVWASLEKGKDEVIAEVVAEVAARDPGKRKRRAVVTDGERALQLRLEKALPGAFLILDLLHVLERLWKVAHSFYAEGSEEAINWVYNHALMILRGEVSQVVKGMKQSATKRKLRGAKRQAIDEAAGYLYRNRKRMRYDKYLALGLPIASGAVEGACKNLVKDRMERSGMRWQVPGAEAMLRLRAIKLSGDMPAYWQFHIQQEQRRLYAGQQWVVAP